MLKSLFSSLINSLVTLFFTTLATVLITSSTVHAHEGHSHALPDLSQLPPGSNNMFGNQAPLTYQPSAQAGGQAMDSAPGGQGAQNPAPSPGVPFDPSQFQRPAAPAGASFPSGAFPMQPRVLPQQQPREEPFVPSEVVSVLPPAVRSNELRAILRTSMGDITIKLDRAQAPQTVNHFVALARGDKEFIDVKTSKKVKRPFYNGLTFHRVVKNFIVQTGCPFGNGRGGPGDIASVRDEIKPMMKFNQAGMVAMAPMRDASGTGIAKDSNGSQFFITLREMPEWDGKYTIFGVVEEGLDILQKISAVNVGPTERPIKRVYLVAIDIFEGEGDHQTLVPPTSAPAQ